MSYNNVLNSGSQMQHKPNKLGFFRRKKQQISETFEFSPEKKLIGIIILFINSLMLTSMFIVSIVNPFYYIHSFTINLLLGDIGSFTFYIFIYIFTLTKLIGINFEKPKWFKLNKITSLFVIATIVTLSMSIINLSSGKKWDINFLTTDFLKTQFWDEKILKIINNKPWGTNPTGEWIQRDFSKMISFNYFGIFPILIWLYPFAGAFTDAIVPLIISILMLLISVSYIVSGSWKAIFQKTYQKSLAGAQKAKQKGKVFFEKSMHQTPEENETLVKGVKDTEEMDMIRPNSFLRNSKVIGRGTLSDSILNKNYKDEVIDAYRNSGMSYHEQEMDKTDKGDFDKSKYAKYGTEYVDGTINKPAMNTDEIDTTFGIVDKEAPKSETTKNTTTQPDVIDLDNPTIKSDLSLGFSGENFTTEPNLNDEKKVNQGMQFFEENIKSEKKIFDEILNETLDISSSNFKREDTMEINEKETTTKDFDEKFTQEPKELNLSNKSEIKKPTEDEEKFGSMFTKAGLRPFENKAKIRIQKMTERNYDEEIFSNKQEMVIDDDKYFNKESLDSETLSTDEFMTHTIEQENVLETNIDSFEETYELHLEKRVDKTTEIIMDKKEVEKIHDFKPKSIPHRTSELNISKLQNNQIINSNPEVLKPIRICNQYKIPSLKYLNDIDNTLAKENAVTLKIQVEQKIATLNGLFESFGVDAKVEGYRIGPRLINFEIGIGYAVKITKITNLEDNIKLALAARSLRIQAPVPGKNVVGIEIPHNNNEIVGIKSVVQESSLTLGIDNNKIDIALGKDSEGRPIVFDLKKTPHLLVAGATGSGKSVAINVMITSLLLQFSPNDLKMILVDPKMVEFTSYRDIPHLIAPIVTDSKKASSVLHRGVEEMENRYKEMSKEYVRNIDELNEKYKSQGKTKMPYLIIIIDELADLMVVAKKDVEESIMRLTQKARAAGIHLILATQKPSTEVITGVIKANIPSRIAFTVTSGYDSKTIIDQVGAENLIGQGDMLISMYGSNIYRGQSAYVSNGEIDKIVENTKKQCSPQYEDKFTNVEIESSVNDGSTINENDSEYIQAKNIIITTRKASTSYLQRRMRIGYNRAANLIDALEHYGVVGPSNGSKSREIYDDI